MSETVIYDVERQCRYDGANFDIPVTVEDPTCGEGFADFATMAGFNGTIPVPEISLLLVVGVLMVLSGVIGAKIAAEDGSIGGISR